MGKGKAKIEIKKIQSLKARNVAFSKRRQGLFNKAVQLRRLFPDVRISSVVFSPAGKPYIFEDPHDVLSGEVVSGNYSEIQKLLEVDIESMGVDELKVYASLLEKSRNSLLLNVTLTAEKEKGKEEISSPEEISAESSNWFYPEIPILEFDGLGTTFASSSLCQEIPDGFDYSPEDLDLDGLDLEAFVNQFFA